MPNHGDMAGALRFVEGSIVSTKDVPSTPWRNGAGTTRQIAALRGTGTTAEFHWRISVAELARDAPFSRFPGIDRTFLVASGRGVVLNVAGTATVLEGGDLVAFPGEDEVDVALPQGPATAVNLMTDRSCRGVVEVRPVEGEQYLPPATVAVLVLEGDASTSRGENLRPMDFFLCGAGIEVLHFTGAIAAFISVSRR